LTSKNISKPGKSQIPKWGSTLLLSLNVVKGNYGFNRQIFVSPALKIGTPKERVA
jgi:hypothetical protein